MKMLKNAFDQLTGNPFGTSFVLATASAAALSLAFISEYVFGLQPCILCLYQRAPFAVADLEAQASPDADTGPLLRRYPRAVAAISARPDEVTEMDAMVAYLQMLGTLVEFRNVRPEDLRQ